MRPMDIGSECRETAYPSAVSKAQIGFVPSNRTNAAALLPRCRIGFVPPNRGRRFPPPAHRPHAPKWVRSARFPLLQSHPVFRKLASFRQFGLPPRPLRPASNGDSQWVRFPLPIHILINALPGEMGSFGILPITTGCPLSIGFVPSIPVAQASRLAMPAFEPACPGAQPIHPAQIGFVPSNPQSANDDQSILLSLFLVYFQYLPEKGLWNSRSGV